MTQFNVTKGFKVPIRKLKSGCRIVDTNKLDEFWKHCDHLANKRGCYVFSMKAAKGEKPFYVGKAAKQSFRNECFSPHKRADHYNVILGERIGTPYLSFVAQQKVKGKWSLTAIDEVEKFLIAIGFARNPELSNRKGLPNQTWSIQGVVAAGKGKPSAEAKAFRTLMGIKPTFPK